MTKFNEIQPGATFIVPADADDVVYTVNTDGTVDAEGMEQMSPEQASKAFANADLRITSDAA